MSLNVIISGFFVGSLLITEICTWSAEALAAAPTAAVAPGTAFVVLKFEEEVDTVTSSWVM